MEKAKRVHYLHFDTIDSTANWAKTHAEELDQEGVTCITAAEQTAGRGRWNRRWLSPRGQNLYVTLYFTLPQSCPYLHHLGQILALSSAILLKRCGFSPQLKWPNDLLIEEKKVAGTLTELVPFTHTFGIALSIGINTNMSQELLEQIDQPATSLAQLTGNSWSNEQILEPLVEQFLGDLALLLKEGFSPFYPAYERLLAYRGKPLCYRDGIHTIEGECLSVTRKGTLLLLLPSGEVRELTAGEVHSPSQA